MENIKQVVNKAIYIIVIKFMKITLLIKTNLKNIINWFKSIIQNIL